MGEGSGEEYGTELGEDIGNPFPPVFIPSAPIHSFTLFLPSTRIEKGGRELGGDMGMSGWKGARLRYGRGVDGNMGMSGYGVCTEGRKRGELGGEQGSSLEGRKKMQE